MLSDQSRSSSIVRHGSRALASTAAALEANRDVTLSEQLRVPAAESAVLEIVGRCSGSSRVRRASSA